MKIENDYSPLARFRARLAEVMAWENADKRQFAANHGYRISDINALYSHNHRAVEMVIKICEDCEVDPGWLLGINEGKL